MAFELSMELKELVESTLEELDERIKEDKLNERLLDRELKVTDLIESDDSLFLLQLKEKLVVLFDGLRDDEVKDLESKLEITLNFLEYTLALIEDKLEGRVDE